MVALFVWDRLRYDLVAMLGLHPDMTTRAPTSVVLDDLLGPEAPEQVTLGWLMGRLGDRSFGIVLLLLARRLLPSAPGGRRQSLDTLGVLLFAAPHAIPALTIPGSDQMNDQMNEMEPMGS